MVRLKSNLRAYYDIASYSDLFLLNIAKILVVIHRGRPARSSSGNQMFDRLSDKAHEDELHLYQESGVAFSDGE